MLEVEPDRWHSRRGLQQLARVQDRCSTELILLIRGAEQHRLSSQERLLEDGSKQHGRMQC